MELLIITVVYLVHDPGKESPVGPESDTQSQLPQKNVILSPDVILDSQVWVLFSAFIIMNHGRIPLRGLQVYARILMSPPPQSSPDQMES